MNNKIKLDAQEKRIEKALAKGEYVSAPNLADTKKLFKQVARNYQELNKTKRITIRVNNQDLIKVKAKAKKNNVPYQTLLNALIRQFAEGQALVRF
ncbi:hypothetical protein ISS42_02945 [Candidatus Shapirobacteria bacterium]|nr:hypothetical protein [Candidatus Shapirobacteria bacterium]